jgi:hypothetical protein
MPHIVLLGDSIFDNASYTRGGPDVITQVRERLPQGWKATLLAVDGSVTLNVPAQLERLPQDAAHLVLSVGGNDALMKSDILNTPLRSTAEALALLADVAGRFEENYREAVHACLRPSLPLGLCTIYNGCFDDVKFQRAVTTALKIFNDAILRIGFERGLPVIDLDSYAPRSRTTRTRSSPLPSEEPRSQAPYLIWRLHPRAQFPEPKCSSRNDVLEQFPLPTRLPRGMATL